MTQALNPELVMTARVRSADMVAKDIRQFDFVAPDGGELPEFTPGSHMLVQAPSGVTRRYSLCSAPQERDHYSIAVKREPGGRGGSVSMVDDVKVGDMLHLSTPRNEFELKDSAPNYLFIAGGIGITPMRSMILHLVNTSERPWKLYYLTRDPEMTAYRDEFTGPEYRGKVVIHHDFGDSGKSLDLWPLLEKPKGAHLYCCGPKGLMDAVRDMTGHWSTVAVHFEDFGAGKSARAVDDRPFVVRMGEGGEPVEVGANVSILEALRGKGHRIPSSCESGTCGSCRMKLLTGEADHRDLVLSDTERLNNIMVCVSRAHSPELVLDL
jgi:phthalate 4,5-dioxygenase reductase subunit